MIPLDLLPALIGFAFVSSITPGPNNLMLMASGANFGVRRSLPHLLGVGLGFTAMIVGVGLGLHGVFEALPWTHVALEVLSVAYLLWLAWKIGTAAPKASDAPEATHPMTFWQAAAFQWVNPKAWMMCVSALTLYAADRSLGTVLLVAAIFGAINLPCISAWTVLGQGMRRLLTSPARLRAFNVAMALLLVATLWPILKAF
ncbi:LysE family translocator [Rubellimicrobium aerolatum]|uniref:LysE family translocator n=1 Tax=Rubellimicrobium aerolatum TaxID=490979 RepID=A0ABW0S7B0_9RHOB|nr:LysE family translocator [Rubellimicrobium aerolatum]MBP1804629.1 threonine/homoserine/homoserine lactone efflux protein [Rubellimicrobium aerolatum]